DELVDLLIDDKANHASVLATADPVEKLRWVFTLYQFSKPVHPAEAMEQLLSKLRYLFKKDEQRFKQVISIMETHASKSRRKRKKNKTVS
ncbi:MAG: hypothetical protein ACR2PT_16675, partial [Endozoicomonas sp.]